MIRRRTLVLSILLLLGFLGVHTLVQREVHGAGVQKIEWTAQWKVPLPGVRAMSAGPDGVLVIGERAVALLGADGSVVRRHDRKAIVIGSTGDLDGDGAFEIVLAGEGPAPTIEALDRSLTPLWAVALPAGALPAARLLVGDLDGDGRREVVVGAGTTLYALSGTGRPLWKHDVLPDGPRGPDAVMRGLDDARSVRDGKKTRHVAFALQSGLFGLIGGDGAMAWTKKGDRLRRLRVVDLDGDGTSELVTGLEGGSVGIWDIAGKSVFSNSLGQAVPEVRAVEVDGDPKTRELGLGGKKGAVQVTRGPGAIWSATVPGKVSAIGGVDLDGDGRDEIFVGTEGGGLSAFAPDGRPLGSTAAGGKVESIVGVVSSLRDRLTIVAAGPTVTAWRLTHRSAPAWYRPEAGALVGVLAILASAVALLGLRAQPVAAAEPEPDGHALRHDSVRAARAQVASLLAKGLARPDQAKERLKQLDRLLAKAESREVRSAPSPQSPPPPPRR